MTSTTVPTTPVPDAPFPPAIVCEGWVRAVDLARELAADVDPIRLTRTDRLAVLAVAPHLAEPLALDRFVAYALAEQELASVPDDDHSVEAAVRRGELGDDCARLLAELLAGHPFVPGSAAFPDPLYAAALVVELRDDLKAERNRTAALRQRIATLEAANLSLVELVEVYRQDAGDPRYGLTSAGVEATGGVVVPLPLAGVTR